MTYPPHETEFEMIQRLTKERDSIKHHMDYCRSLLIKHQMDYCRSLLKTPADDVLSESIAAIIKERDELKGRVMAFREELPSLIKERNELAAKVAEMESTHTEIVANQLFLRAQAEQEVERLRGQVISMPCECNRLTPFVCQRCKALEDSQ